MDRELLKSTYFYDLPEELIAQTPIEPRDHSRLLCFNRKNDKLQHKHFYYYYTCVYTNSTVSTVKPWLGRLSAAPFTFLLCCRNC